MEEMKSQMLNKLSTQDYMERTISLYEKYDVKNLAILINSELIDEETINSLNKYKKFGKKGVVKVNYKVNKIGRLSVKVDGVKEDEGCISQGNNMPKICKSALCSKYYHDLDIVNAHPEMLYQIYTSLGYDCPLFKVYVKNRSKVFKKCKEDYDMNRDAVKVAVLKLFYGGSGSDLPEYFKALEKELKVCRDKILQKNELLEYRMEAMKRKGEENWNIDGTALSYYLQTHECKVLLTMYDFLIGQGYKVGALIHDGIHIDRELKDDDKKNLLALIKKKTGFELDVVVKQFSEVPGLDDTILIESDKEGGDILSDLLKNDYVICNERVFMRLNDVWTSNDKHIKRGLVKMIGNVNMCVFKTDKDGNVCIEPYSRMTKGCNALIPFIEPTEDPDFIDKLWSSNIGKLCFKNGYYDFKSGSLKPYDNEVHTTIKINRNYEEADQKHILEVYDRILNPIFNHDKEMLDCWLNYIARGLAGHVEDKNWAVGIGERDCGKGVLGGGLENCFVEYVRATNSENFLYKSGQSDSAKALSWLVPFEFKRLLLTNEITKDAEGKYRINGNILKKLSSGGDKIEARVNHKDEINFKIQARVCMFCNDLPPIEPSDAKETSYMFKYPSKFVSGDDERLEKPVMRPKTSISKDTDGNDIILKELDENGNEIMINVCNFYKKDDEIKSWFKKPEIMNAFISIIFGAYKEKVKIPLSMKEEQEDFKDDETDESKFYDLFTFMGDKGYDLESEKDFVSISMVNVLLRKAGIAASPQKYKNWLMSKGAVKAKRQGSDGKRVNAWVYVQVNEDKKDEIINGIDMDD